MTAGPDEPAPDRPGRSAGGSGGTLGRLTRTDGLIGLGAVLFAVLMVVPWFSSIEVRGVEYDLARSANGFDSGALVLALLLLVAAGVWAALPAVKDLPTSFPRGIVTVALAALAFLLTLVEWLDTTDLGFSVAAFLAFLTVCAVLVLTVLRLRTELRVRAASRRAPRAGQEAPGEPDDGAGWGRPEPIGYDASQDGTPDWAQAFGPYTGPPPTQRPPAPPAAPPPADELPPGQQPPPGGP